MGVLGRGGRGGWAGTGGARGERQRGTAHQRETHKSRHREQTIEMGNGTRATVNDTAVQLADANGWYVTLDHTGKIVCGGKGRDLGAMRALAAEALSKSWWAKKAPAPQALAAPPVARRVVKTRCPNPRDCGDPGCDGSCGYPAIDADGRWV